MTTDLQRISLAGRRALVTGAAAGIGREVALEMARRGAQVVALDLQPEPLDLLVSEAAGTPGSIVSYVCDLREVDAFEDLVAWMDNQLGGLDILANVAGVTRWKSWDEVTLDDWEVIMDVDARAVFFLTQKIVPLMARGGGGAVVTISSVSGKGFRGTSSPAYAGAKAAVISISRVLSHALAPFRIRVNCICPGPVDTGFLAEGMEGFAARRGSTDEEERQSFLAQVPLKRAAPPIDIADLVCFLAGDTGASVTGQAWNVDGGLVFD
ncbi:MULTISPECIES: SDR family NAD(P)-dependent oxidoreductase [unclassified Nocardioides]|uniref:SDR family NAD(P)-dependent oxidoreductase n=1 Tax=unclassified Nocardioides TaxID=2615069 RepID=UPI0006F49A81|nr:MULTISPECIES: SDR family oxidoreductase [unclassified Nocardioides]